MKADKSIFVGTGMIVVIVALALTSSAMVRSAAEAGPAIEAPMFEVDPLWPQPLPNHWILGSTVGVGVDSRDHVYIIHRGNCFNPNTECGAAQDPPSSECCVPAPPILEFDPEGNLVNSWGGPSDEYTWPTSNHGITVDPKDNIWIGGNGSGDSHILKFTRDGTFLMEIGMPGQGTNSNTTEHFGRVAKISFDATGDEAYIADGYRNRRVAVLDANTGEVKRFWGAYGNTPNDSNIGRYDPEAPLAQQFRTPVHCAEPSNDGFVYVCDRPNDRIQVFRTDGTYVTEKIIAPLTRGDGSTWDIAFSKDPDQRFMYLADGKNMKVYIMERESLEILTTFGDGGRQPGLFYAVHSIATDSRGNIYTTETYEGKRLQKFVYKGMGPVAEMNQGAPWPRGN